jgi:hypothetical protein
MIYLLIPILSVAVLATILYPLWPAFKLLLSL